MSDELNPSTETPVEETPAAEEPAVKGADIASEGESTPAEEAQV